MIHRTLVAIALYALTASAALADATDRPAERAAPAKPFQIVSAKKEKLLRRCLPRVDDEEIQAILSDPRTLLYTEDEMPRAYQVWDGQLQGVHSPDYNISANGREPFGNGNREFPWNAPAGTHRCDNVTSFRFLWLPQDENGRTLPVVWFREHLDGDSSQGYAWRYPVGAVLGEVLLVKGPDELDYTFELRVRIRERGDWDTNVFRPFPTARHLARRIRELRPNWYSEPDLMEFVTSLESPVKLVSQTLSDRAHDLPVFEQTMGVDKMPALGAELVADLLSTTTFISAHGETWRDGADGNWTFAPTTDAEFHVVPANYDAGFIEVDRASCLRCHESVNQHVTNFEYGRDWYGRIRGSDGIFSFHPFEPYSVSFNGYGGRPSIRTEFVEAGVVAAFNAKKHPNAIYHQVPHLQE